jgi:hypothetical protein
MGSDLGEAELGVVGVHLPDLFPRWSAQDFDNLHELVYPRVPGEDGLAQEQLCQYTSCTPHICNRNTGIEIPHLLINNNTLNLNTTFILI